jgi:hypothetical protein
MSQIEHLETPVTIAPMTEASPLLRGWWRRVDMRWHHSTAAVPADVSADGGVRVVGQAAARTDDDDSATCAGRLCLRRDR